MKIRPTHSVEGHLIRGAFYLLLLLAVCMVPFAQAQRKVTKQSMAKLGDALPFNIIIVTNTNDSGPGSLRDALAIANDGDTIDATGISGTILLTSGELQINDNVIINGPGAGSLGVDGDATFRVFENFASNVTISGFTITNGLVADSNGGGGILNHGGLTLSDSILSSNIAVPPNTDGGGINTAGGTLTVANSTISGNHCTGGGGGIWGTDGATVTVFDSTINGNGAGCAGGGINIDNAQLTVMNSTISGNSISGPCQGGPGGGIAFGGGGTLAVTNCIISNNSAGGSPNGIGAGMFLFGDGSATVTDSTISDNSTGSAGGGGGISNSLQMLTVTNCTISGNSTAGGGGGIMNVGNPASLTVRNSTISGNSSGDGGGIFNGGQAIIGDTVLNAGESGGTIFNDGGMVTSLGYNIASDAGGGVLTGPGDQINTDPMLGPLQDNGGPTFTHELLPGSPAINAGDQSFTPPPFYDQRGFDRVVNGRIDIGSFEVQPTLIPRATPTPRPRPTPRPHP